MVEGLQVMVSGLWLVDMSIFVFVFVFPIWFYRYSRFVCLFLVSGVRVETILRLQNSHRVVHRLLMTVNVSCVVGGVEFVRWEMVWEVAGERERGTSDTEHLGFV